VKWRNLLVDQSPTIQHIT